MTVLTAQLFSGGTITINGQEVDIDEERANQARDAIQCYACVSSSSSSGCADEYLGDDSHQVGCIDTDSYSITSNGILFSSYDSCVKVKTSAKVLGTRITTGKIAPAIRWGRRQESGGE